MQTVLIPQLNRAVSRLGMGSMVMSPERRELTFALLDRFVELGGNLIDSAEVYGGGNSERAIGLWLAERGTRRDVVILTKGLTAPEKFTRAGLRDTISGNLERLGTDYIDVWVMHRDNPEVPVQTILEILNEEAAQGRIRAFGGSNWSVARIAEANAYAAQHGLMGLAISSPHVCLAVAKEPFWSGCTQASEADLAWYAQAGMPVAAWSSQGRGFFLEASGPGDTDEDMLRVYHNPENLERLRRARELAKEKGLAAIQIALAYVLNQAPPMIALVGPAAVAELEMSVAAEGIALTAAEMAWLDLKRDAR